jgi:tripeptidyl-peptidase-1
MRVSSVSGSLLLLSLASVVCGAPQALKLRQSVASPRNWVDLGRASRTHVIPLRIALPQPRFPELEQHLAEISDPSHARYGEHLSKADVEELVTPHASSVDAVYGWLESHGVQKEACHRSPAGDWVTVSVPVAQAEEMLGTVRRDIMLRSCREGQRSARVLGVPRVATRFGRRCPRAHDRVQSARTPR